ncbi:MAG: hypothetical protein V1918_02595 [Planctomycetota bacterium]
MPEIRTIFLAGIIQGSLPDAIVEQDYRPPIVAALREAFPRAEIYDPIACFPNSLNFDEARAKKVFFDLMRRAAETDLLVAYLPSASMGTAIELWNAFHAGKPVVVIGPLKKNWVVRFLADHVCESIGEFAAWARSGALGRLAAGRASSPAGKGPG